MDGLMQTLRESETAAKLCALPCFSRGRKRDHDSAVAKIAAEHLAEVCWSENGAKLMSLPMSAAASPLTASDCRCDRPGGERRLLRALTFRIRIASLSPGARCAPHDASA